MATSADPHPRKGSFEPALRTTRSALICRLQYFQSRRRVPSRSLSLEARTPSLSASIRPIALSSWDCVLDSPPKSVPVAPIPSGQSVSLFISLRSADNNPTGQTGQIIFLSSLHKPLAMAIHPSLQPSPASRGTLTPEQAELI